MKKRIVTLLCAAMCIISMVGCSMQGAVNGAKSGNHATRIDAEDDAEDEDDDNDDTVVAVTDDTEDGRERTSDYTKATMMIYMVGSNLESDYGAASLDVKEMLESGYDENNLEVYLCLGGARAWHINDVPNDKCTIYRLENGRMSYETTMNGRNMAEGTTLTEFVDYCYQDSTGDCYSLVMWDHGGGAVLGFGADENYNYEAMELRDMKDSLAGSALVRDGKYFEWIGFDACLMGMLEVADGFSDYANYLVASEEVEPGYGWDYGFMSPMSKNAHFDGPDAAKDIIDFYSDFYENNKQYQMEYSLSCVDLAKMDSLMPAFDAFVEAADADLYNNNYAVIASRRDGTKDYGVINGMSVYDSIDLYDLAERMRKLYPNEVNELTTQISNAVVYQKANIANTNGIAIYFPYSNQAYAKEWLDIYEDMGFSSSYVKFLGDFTAVLNGAQLADFHVSDNVATQSSSNPGEYYINLNETEMMNYGHASFSIWEKDPELHDYYFCWIDSNEVELDENTGRLTADFDNKIFYLCDEAGEKAAGTAFELEHNDQYSTYQMRIVYYDLDFNVNTAFVYIRVDDRNPNGIITGIYQMQSGDSLFPNNQPVFLEDGFVIDTYIRNRRVIFNDDGTVAPFEEWQNDYFMADEFTLTGRLSVSIEEQEEPVEYCCFFTVTDVQGNTYWSSPFEGEEHLAEGAYLVDGVDTSKYAPDNVLDQATNTFMMYDAYEKPIVLLGLPSGYSLENSVDCGRWIYLKNGSSDEEIDVSTSSFNPLYKEAILGEHSTSSYSIQDCNFTVTERNIGGLTVLEVNGEYTYDGSYYSQARLVYIPYLDYYGDQQYVEIDFGRYFNDCSDSEFEEMLKTLLRAK